MGYSNSRNSCEQPNIQSGHPECYGDQERCLHRDTIAPIPATVGRNFAAYYPVKQRHGRPQLHQYIITDDDFLRDLRDYTSSVLEPLPSISADHIAVGDFSDNSSVAEFLERVSETARRGTLQ